MKDQFKTKQTLIQELSILRQRIAEREQSKSELKQVDELLRKNEEKYRTLFEESFDGLFITSPEGRILDMNKKGVMMFGYDTKEEILSLDLERDVYADPPDRKRILSLVNAQGTAEYDVVVKKKNGETMITHCALTAVKNESGVITSYRGIIRDITAHKRAEEALRKSEEKFRNVFDWASDAIILHTITTEGAPGRFIDVNQLACRMLGYSWDELLTMGPPDIIPTELHPLLGEIIRQAAIKESFLIETRLIRKDGTIFPVESSAHLITYEGKRIWLSHIRDITKRKQAEEALHAANLYNRSLIEASLDPLVTIGANGKITDVNAATEAVTGYTRTELIGTEFSDYFTEPEQARAGYEEVFRVGSVHDHPLELRHRNGHVTSVLYNASVYRDEKGQVAGVFAAARDISARKLAEARLHASLREKEILLREIHHRVKNNMQVITGLLDLQAKSSGNKELIELLLDSQRRIRSMALVHEKFYDSKDFTRIDLTEYVRTLSQELFQSYKTVPEKIDLIIQIHRDVYMDINKVIPCGMILNELISNALKHAFPGDRKGELQIIIYETKNTEVEIVIRDNGVSLPNDVDIHQPRTVGLYLVSGLVKNQLDGKIEVRRGAGTEFRIKFPL